MHLLAFAACLHDSESGNGRNNKDKKRQRLGRPYLREIEAGEEDPRVVVAQARRRKSSRVLVPVS